MAAIALEPGAHGEIIYTMQMRDENGKWKTTTNRRKAERWRAQCYYRTLQGVRGRSDKTADTQAKALTKVKLDLAQKLSANHGSGSEYLIDTTLFVDAGREWLEHIKRPGSGLSPRTVDEYARAFARYIEKPSTELRTELTAKNAHVRDVRLKDVNTTQRLAKFLQAVADNHGPSGAHFARSVLAGILNRAISFDVLPMSALSNVGTITAPKKKKTEHDTERSLSREQRKALIAHADAVANEEGPYNPRTRRMWQTAADLLYFMATTGARVSEARTLRWEAVHLSGDCGCRNPYEPHGIVVGKGHRGEARPRRVNFPHDLAHRMRRRHLATGATGYVFSAPALTDTEREWDQSGCNKALRKLLDGAGLTWATPHSLRRTVVTLAHEGGEPLNKIADQVGHVDPVMTARKYLGRDAMGPRQSVADKLAI